MHEFILFIRRQGVVGLAIGFVMGGAVSKLVTSLVVDLIQPAIGLIFGSPDGLKNWMVGPFGLGNFLFAFIDFVIIAIVIYVVFKQLKLERLDKCD